MAFIETENRGELTLWCTEWICIYFSLWYFMWIIILCHYNSSRMYICERHWPHIVYYFSFFLCLSFFLSSQREQSAAPASCYFYIMSLKRWWKCENSFRGVGKTSIYRSWTKRRYQMYKLFDVVSSSSHSTYCMYIIFINWRTKHVSYIFLSFYHG